MKVLLVLLLCQTATAATISATAGPLTLSAPGTLSYLGAPGAYAGASVNWGSLSISTSCGPNCSEAASAQFADRLTFDTSGFLVAAISIQSIAYYGEGIADASLRFGTITSNFIGNQPSGPCIVTCSLEAAITAGTPLAFSAGASVWSTDFAGDTAHVSFSFSFLGTDHKAASGFRYAADSGHDYLIAGGTDPAPGDLFLPAPECSTWWGAIAGVLLLRRKRT